jgi:CubicO group peptidase (beta-lactamase class C family)
MGMIMGDAQQAVQDVLDELVTDGVEQGVQVAAFVDGAMVVDAVAGVADPATGRRVQPDTVFYNFSIGKGAMATLVHQQVDAGAFGYDTPVAQLWPEFARHGKQAITVRQVLDHTAGVPGLPPDSTIDSITDWTAMVAALEDAEPWWEPGTKVGYHAYTFGYLAGEIVRRATGRPLAQVLHDDLAAPIGHPDEIWFGMPESARGSLAVLTDAPSDVDWSAMEISPDEPMFRAAPPAVFPTAELGNDPRVIGADIPAGGKVSARALARMYASLLGEVDGVRLLSAERFREATTVSSSGPDQVYGDESSWGLGWAAGVPWDEQARSVFGMAGAGGSWAGVDLDRGLAFAVTKNVLSMDFDALTRVGRTLLAELDRG